MNIMIKQMSSLKKIRNTEDMKKGEINKKLMFGGETFSYQTALYSEDKIDVGLSVESLLKDYIKLYLVKNVMMDYPIEPFSRDEDFLTKEPGVMPDLLLPAEEQNNCVRLSGGVAAVWIEINIPKNFKAGEYPVKIKFSGMNIYNNDEKFEAEQLMNIEVAAADIPEQSTIFTQWFHTDCIAAVHNAEIYSEKHWELIDKYMSLAAKLGMNMILTPVITPPLDTEIGGFRPNVQLVKIEKKNEKYIFDFSKLERWISLCRKNGIKYYEISHLFSQWGLKYSPNISVSEDGKEKYIFGWHVPARDKSYKDFLEQFIPALVKILHSEGIEKQCFFHLSDEPSKEHVDDYRYAYEIVKPLIGECRIMDALSDVDFYENGLLSTPVTATSHIEPFLEKNIKNQWAYYCCAQDFKVGNRFMAMPSYRNRILGLQIYKFGIEGFLQWGYNFYFSQHSKYLINPYITSSSDRAFPSGDPFSVYPGNDRPLPSLRALIFREALQDVEICRMLEKYEGKEKVIELIEQEAGEKITFSEYPGNEEFIIRVMEKIAARIKKYC